MASPGNPVGGTQGRGLRPLDSRWSSPRESGAGMNGVLLRHGARNGSYARPASLRPLSRAVVAAHRGGHQENGSPRPGCRSTLLASSGGCRPPSCAACSVDHPRHPLSTSGCSYCPRIAELLGEVALADEDRADARHLLAGYRAGLDGRACPPIIRDHEHFALGLSATRRRGRNSPAV